MTTKLFKFRGNTIGVKISYRKNTLSLNLRFSFEFFELSSAHIGSQLSTYLFVKTNYTLLWVLLKRLFGALFWTLFPLHWDYDSEQRQNRLIGFSVDLYFKTYFDGNYLSVVLSLN